MSQNNIKQVLGVSRLSPKNQVTIPKDARIRFNLNPSDRIIFQDEDGKLIITKG